MMDLSDFKNPISTTFDLSHISHFLLYYIFGIIYPKKYILIITISLLWEILEIIIVQNETLYYLTKKYWIIPEKYWNETIVNKIIDLFMNLFGYYLGSHTKFRK